MSLMSKFLTSILISTLIANAGDSLTPDDLKGYMENHVVKNPQVDIEGVTIVEETTHPDLPGWKIYLTTVEIDYMGKEMSVPETVFFKDGLITGELISLDKGLDYRELIKPTVPESLYDNAHLIYGSKNAAHKILVFSDPRCPFCQDIIPKIMNAAKAHPDKLALYYYHLPLLRIHPVSDILTRVMHVAQSEGKIDILEKIYRMKIKAKETNVPKVLAEVKKQTGYSVTAKQINTKEVKEAVAADMRAAGRMMVKGTPTVFLDGIWDRNRTKYKELIK
jgi:thiol:disulfide interchange protein DsbC